MEKVATVSSTLVPYGTTISGVATLIEGQTIKTDAESKKILLDGATFNVINCSNGTVQQATGTIKFTATSKNNIEGKKPLRVGDIGEGVVNGVIPGSPPTPGSFNAQFQIVDGGQVSVLSK